jgi:hypothetical protein
LEYKRTKRKMLDLLVYRIEENRQVKKNDSTAVKRFALFEKKIVVEQTAEEKGKEEKGSLKFANDISRRVVETDI